MSLFRMMSAPAIGIDLGTSYCRVSVYRYGKVEVIPNKAGNLSTPSWVAFTDSVQLVGEEAVAQAEDNPENTIYDIKRLIGRQYDDPAVQEDMKKWPFKVVNEDNELKIQVQYKRMTQTFTPEEITSIMIKKMKELAEEFLGRTVKDTVITVPAYFNDAQRYATRDAAMRSDLNVLRVLNEPTAAALTYSEKCIIGESFYMAGCNKKTVLIYDLGGGTFDVSLLFFRYGNYEVVATSGDTHFGGNDFEERMVEHCIEEFKQRYFLDVSKNKRALRLLRSACEQAKVTLSEENIATIEIKSLFGGFDFYTTIYRSSFEEWNADLFKRTLEPIENCLKSAEVNKYEVDDIVLVGGTTYIPKIRSVLKSFFVYKQLNTSIKPNEAVAYGTGVHAAVLHGDTSYAILRLPTFCDIIPKSLGVEVYDKTFSIVITRNTTVPARQTKQFTTATNNQTAMCFSVYEGENHVARNNNFLGSFSLGGIIPAPAGEAKIDVTFDIDLDGILNVKAYDRQTGNQNSLTITKSRSRASNDEYTPVTFFRKRERYEEGCTLI